jgi:hypothetical protein
MHLMHIGYAYIQDDDLGRNVKSWHLHKIFVQISVVTIKAAVKKQVK